MLKRSAELEKVLTDLLKITYLDNSARAESGNIMCSVSFEHAESAKNTARYEEFHFRTGPASYAV
ncbi:MAG: hypothetical protein ACI8PB_004261 [Desulforhopalus sp.]|jgi:hypothetical protein